ncbi:putative replication-associated protein [Protobacilladnavirus tenuis]|uniref:Replication-associated protein n=1 Tax=Protobacilladnavirus tenuis TaxID=3052706 RepID=E3WH29_9VIRU|nr:putative replication-associated protein [Protobacilladnavirus tenuis]BAJ40167.1 putative replication-associated protein [Protobacilladnavirus tenuis]
MHFRNMSNNSFDIQELICDDASIDCSISINTTPSVDFLETELKEPTNNTLISRAILTYFPPTSDAKYLEPEFMLGQDIRRLSNWWSQYEKCPESGAVHIHAYAEFKRELRPRFNLLDELIRSHVDCWNCRTARKSSESQRQGAINYVHKFETRLDGFQPFTWPKNESNAKFDPSFVRTNSKQNKRKARDDAIEEQRQYIESKPRIWTWDQILHENEASKKLLVTCSWGKKYHEGRHAEDKRRDVTDVIIYYGAGGTGKTTLCMEYNQTSSLEPRVERYYRRNPDDGNFWGGGRTAYKGQRVIHFEEFSGQEPFSRLKEVCDIGKPGPSVNIKGAGVDLNHHTVMFSSNVHPAGWYRNLWRDDPKQFHPFWRRVTKVVFFPSHRPDGSMNIPDEDNPPHMIDQTDEWKALNGSYEACMEHADEHWPVREVSVDGFVKSFNHSHQTSA